MYSPSTGVINWPDSIGVPPTMVEHNRALMKKALIASCYGGSIHDAYAFLRPHGWKLFKCHVRQAVNILTAKKLRASLRAKLRRLAAKRLNLYTHQTCVGCDMCMYTEDDLK